MDDRATRALGATAGVGAVLSVLTAVPSKWYGVRETDAHLFDPALFSPLWIERTLVPVASLVALAMLVAGLAGLVLRDRGATGRLRRWGGYAAVAGTVLLWGALLAFTVGVSASRGGSELVSVVLVLGGALGLVAALALVVPGLIATGVGYVRVDRPVVGYALVGGTAVSFLVTAFFWVADPETGLGFLPSAVPFAAAFVGVAHELWTHPEPVPGPDADEEPTPGRGGAERTGPPDAGDDEGSPDGGPLDDASAAGTAPGDGTGSDGRPPTDDGDGADGRTPTDDGDGSDGTDGESTEST